MWGDKKNDDGCHHGSPACMMCRAGGIDNRSLRVQEQYEKDLEKDRKAAAGKDSNDSKKKNKWF